MSQPKQPPEETLNSGCRIVGIVLGLNRARSAADKLGIRLMGSAGDDVDNASTHPSS